MSGTTERAGARPPLEAETLGFGVAGSPGTRLLAGPPRAEGAEAYAGHLERLGRLAVERISPRYLLDEVASSGLTGRGGGQFPTARKLRTAAEGSRPPLVVVNASEGEPASRKDRTLLSLRPHLVIDGALVAARVVGASQIVVYLHRSVRPSAEALERALAERPGDGSAVRVVDAPARYVAGESSAVVGYLSGEGALPRRSRVPAARCGVGGRPTVVCNVETIAQLALVARYGAAWFRSAGTPEGPGSTLVTLAGAVAVPGLVAEVLGPVPLGGLLCTIGGLDRRPRAVLLGGYAGSWIDGEIAWRTPLERAALERGGTPLGCGLVAVLGGESCGLATTSRLLRWLVGESAGQCGPCVFGLPALAEHLEALVAGEAGPRDVRRLGRLAASLRGQGACGHPTGVSGLVESALDTFADEVADHLHGYRCAAALEGFPLPTRPGAT